MNTFFVISLIALCSALIAVVIIVLYYNSLSHVTFVFSSIFVQLFLWTAVQVIGQYVHDAQQLIYLSRLSLTAVLFFPATFVHFSYFFYKPAFISNKNLFALYALPAIALPFTFTSLTASHFISDELSLSTVNLGPLYYVYVVYFVGYSAWSMHNLIRRYLRPGNTRRMQLQLRYIIIGFAFAMTVSLGANVVLPKFFSTYPDTTYGPLSSYAVVVTTLYAIIRLRFFHITITVQKNALITFVVFLWTIIYTGCSVLLFSFLYQADRGQVFLFAYIFISLGAHFIVTYFLIVQLQRFLETLHFQERVHFSKFFTDAPGNTTLNATHELESFSLKFAGIIQEKTEAPVQFLYILQEPYNRYVDFFKPKNKTLYFANGVVRELFHGSGVHMLNDLANDPEKKELVRFLKKQHVEFLITVNNVQKSTADKPIAFIGVGRHKNNRDFLVNLDELLADDIEYAEHSIPALLQWEYTVEDLKGRIRDGKMHK